MTEFIGENPSTSEDQPLQLHPLIEMAYSRVMNSLGTDPQIRGFTNLDYRSELLPNLYSSEDIYTAAQFHTFFPAHLFKMQNIVKVSLAKQAIELCNPHFPLVLVDVGCGTGAATVALLNTILHLQCVSKNTERTIKVIALDPDRFALRIFKDLLDSMISLMSEQNIRINLDYDRVPQGLPAANDDVLAYLHAFAREQDVPRLSQVLVLQSNIIPPLNQLLRERNQRIEELVDQGFEEARRLVAEYGTELAQLNNRIVRELSVDQLIVQTLATDSGVNFRHLLVQIRQQITSTLVDHDVIQIDQDIFLDNQVVTYINAQSSRFGYNQEPYTSPAYFANVVKLEHKDRIWHRLVSYSNIQLAWARSRNALLRESLADEVEIRLFERNPEVLKSRLQELIDQLIAYANDIARTDSRIPYPFPKSSNQARPRILSRLEEDVLSVAVVQALTPEFQGELTVSYDYRPEQGDNEYLYEYYLNAYKKFTRDVRSAAETMAEEHPHGVIIRTDIKSFYTQIVQHQLINEQLREGYSQRVRWLLKQILEGDLPSVADLSETQHEEGRGITQGGSASGFFSKLYLRSIPDTILASKKQIRIFRYADDMVVLIPNPSDLKEAITELEKLLDDLGLELSEEKTSQPHQPREFLEKLDQYSLDDLDQDAALIRKRVLRPLFVMVRDYRYCCNQYHVEGRWWDFVERYRECLQSVGIYFSANWLSRKVQEHLKRPRDVTLLNYPDLSTFLESTPDEWAEQFQVNNRVKVATARRSAT